MEHSKHLYTSFHRGARDFFKLDDWSSAHVGGPLLVLSLTCFYRACVNLIISQYLHQVILFELLWNILLTGGRRLVIGLVSCT